MQCSIQGKFVCGQAGLFRMSCQLERFVFVKVVVSEGGLGVRALGIVVCIFCYTCIYPL